jgi:hypothetical protein
LPKAKPIPIRSLRMATEKKWKPGDVREDGYVFNRIVRAKLKDGSVREYPQFLHPMVFKRTADALKKNIRRWQKKHAKRVLEQAKERRRADPEHYRKKSREANARRRDKAIAYMRERYASDPEKYRRLAKEWRQRNPDYQKKRFAKKPEAKLAAMLRRRILKALDGEVKSGSTYELLGCTWEHLRWHIEAQFDGKMTWENHGSYWHLDHILPLDSFDLSDPAQQRRACHWKNLQPLEAKENIRKKNRLPQPQRAKRKSLRKAHKL